MAQVREKDCEGALFLSRAQEALQVCVCGWGRVRCIPSPTCTCTADPCLAAPHAASAAAPVAAALQACRAAGVPLVINDRVDIALALGPDVGVHVGQSDLPVHLVSMGWALALHFTYKIRLLWVTNRESTHPWG